MRVTSSVSWKFVRSVARQTVEKSAWITDAVAENMLTRESERHLRYVALSVRNVWESFRHRID